MPINIITDEFKAKVLESKIPVIVDFWATWCGPCRAVSPILDQLEEEQDGALIVVKVNVDEEPALASMFNVSSIPTILFVKDGKVVARQIGAATLPTFRSLIQS